MQDRLSALIEYAVKTGLENDGVFLSNDESAAAICFQEPARTSLSSNWNQLQLIRKAIGFARVPQVLKREAYLKKHRPAPPYLNLWFLGVDLDQKGSGEFMTSGKAYSGCRRKRTCPSSWKHPWNETCGYMSVSVFTFITPGSRPQAIRSGLCLITNSKIGQLSAIYVY